MSLSCLFAQNLGLGLFLFKPHNETLLLYHQEAIDSIWWDADLLDFQTSLAKGFSAYEEQVTTAVLYFEIVEEKNDSILILFNQKTQESAWIYKDEAYDIIPWAAFLTRFNLIEISTKAELKASPFDDAPDIRRDPCGKYLVIQIQDEWIEVRPEDCGLNIHADRAWVKWTDGERLLVSALRSE